MRERSRGCTLGRSRAACEVADHKPGVGIVDFVRITADDEQLELQLRAALFLMQCNLLSGRVDGAAKGRLVGPVVPE